MKLASLWCICLGMCCVCSFSQNRSFEADIRNRLFPGGKAIGQPLTSRQPYIRMLRVDSYQEAYDFFRHICLVEDKVKIRQHNGHPYYFYSLPNDGYFVFTDDVVKNRNEVAVLWIKVPSLIKQGIREIHFVETIKIKR